MGTRQNLLMALFATLFIFFSCKKTETIETVKIETEELISNGGEAGLKDNVIQGFSSGCEGIDLYVTEQSPGMFKTFFIYAYSSIPVAEGSLNWDIYNITKDENTPKSEYANEVNFQGETNMSYEVSFSGKHANNSSWDITGDFCVYFSPGASSNFFNVGNLEICDGNGEITECKIGGSGVGNLTSEVFILDQEGNKVTGK